MPIFRYFCDDCTTEFEETILKSDEVKEFFDWHPCPECKQRAERIRVNSVSFGFKSALSDGNTGIHSVDYPKLDIAVGRSADKKRSEYTKKKEQRDKIRKSIGTNYVSESGGSVRALDSKSLDLREKGSKMFKKVNKNIT